MKTLLFRPLRFVKSLDKIVVASYSQWNRVKTADYNKFNLVIDDMYRKFSGNALVYNHVGEQLFWRDYEPSSITVFDFRCGLTFDEMRAINSNFAYSMVVTLSYHSKGLDCQGTPIFSHGTVSNIVNGHREISKINEYDLLTVDIVRKWYGWFLFNLENSSITIKL